MQKENPNKIEVVGFGALVRESVGLDSCWLPSSLMVRTFT